ncbi:MAG: RNA 2',3'-cyclic phosphodiesterase [Chlorobi bacterium]|nr:RNA 2',3'-cyclic phosphodiesterase [Chlorobiota bacterium]
MKRLFAAIKINPSEGFIQTYYILKTNLRNEKIKWVNIDNIHITLKFFGETPDEIIPDISKKLNAIAALHSNFTLDIRDIGVFGSSYKPRVIWFGIEEDEALLNLSKEVLNEMDKLGFKQDRQNFVPHLTIGRIKFIEDKKRFQQVIDKCESTEIQKQEILGFNLYESILKPQGPEYSIIESFSLL